MKDIGFWNSFILLTHSICDAFHVSTQLPAAQVKSSQPDQYDGPKWTIGYLTTTPLFQKKNKHHKEAGKLLFAIEQQTISVLLQKLLPSRQTFATIWL